jgi:hypothetical protein
VVNGTVGGSFKQREKIKRVGKGGRHFLGSPRR